MSTENGSFDPEPYIGLIVYNILNAVCFGSRLVDFSKCLFPIISKIYIKNIYIIIINIFLGVIFIIGLTFNSIQFNSKLYLESI